MTLASEFRRHVREWIRSHAPAGLADAAVSSPAYREWERHLLTAGLICPSWPAEYGGSARNPVEILAFREECARAGVPWIDRGVGEHVVGPLLLAYGSTRQRSRFLPGIVAGTDRYCRAFTEPAHGSDLSSIETRGTVRGAEIELTGRKTWVQAAESANMLCVLCRTDAPGPAAGVLALVLVPWSGTAGAGTESQPIRQLTGSSGGYQIDLRGTRVPVGNVVGGAGLDWPGLAESLRRASAGNPQADYLGFESDFWELVRQARKSGRAEEPGVRARLALVYGQITQLRYAAQRLAELVTAGEPAEPLASAATLRHAEFRQRFSEIALNVTGLAGLTGPDRAEPEADRWRAALLATRSATIDPETSEMQRNSIAERLLGLPGDAAGRDVSVAAAPVSGPDLPDRHATTDGRADAPWW